MFFRILIACFICLFVASCDTQEQTEISNKTIEVKIVPEQASENFTQQKTRPALNLTIDDISIDQKDQYDFFDLDKKLPKTHSKIFETLTRDQAEPSYNLSGKILTDEEKIDNKEYLDAVDGLQINIEGSFQ